jgi:DNA-binding GntR family transcriptional regulator
MRHSVVDAIRRALMQGRFQPGEALSDVALAAEMGISRGPVREALLMLAEEGLVVHLQNRGFSVLQFTKQDAKEVQQVRMPLETLALELAVERVKPDALRKLEQLADGLCTGFEKGEIVEATRCDLEFHHVVWELSGNSRLITSLRTLTAPYFAYGSAFRLGRPDLCAELLRQQHDVYLECLRGNPAYTAAECVRFHIYQWE